MKTIFLDIDGTLMRTQGAGLKAILEVMSTRYGVQEIPEVTFQGRTDLGIWQDIFFGLGLEMPDSIDDLITDYCDRLEQRLAENPGILLPGVETFMNTIAGDERFAVGILTGNAKRAASIKLRTFGLSQYVLPFGGYGDHFDQRGSVAKMAAESARNFLTHQYEEDAVWVIGDTINDINCARAIGARVLAVGTGGTSLNELASAQPDALHEDLTNLDSVLHSILD